MADPGPRRPADAIFPKRRTAIMADKCADCDEDVKQFRDGLSKREYTISGLCQECQDVVFGTSNDNYEDER